MDDYYTPSDIGYYLYIALKNHGVDWDEVSRRSTDRKQSIMIYSYLPVDIKNDQYLMDLIGNLSTVGIFNRRAIQKLQNVHPT